MTVKRVFKWFALGILAAAFGFAGALAATQLMPEHFRGPAGETGTQGEAGEPGEDVNADAIAQILTELTRRLVLIESEDTNLVTFGCSPLDSIEVVTDVTPSPFEDSLSPFTLTTERLCLD